MNLSLRKLILTGASLILIPTFALSETWLVKESGALDCNTTWVKQTGKKPRPVSYFGTTRCVGKKNNYHVTMFWSPDKSGKYTHVEIHRDAGDPPRCKYSGNIVRTNHIEGDYICDNGYKTWQADITDPNHNKNT